MVQTAVGAQKLQHCDSPGGQIGEWPVENEAATDWGEGGNGSAEI